MTSRLTNGLLIVALALAGAVVKAATDSAAQDADMDRMIDAIRLDARQTASYTGRSRLSDQVLDAMRAVPRDRFVPPGAEAYAFENRPLPIGHGQTISQPFIVALMTDLLALESGDRVLEIGTGSGYQAAVLAELGADVYTIEIVADLAEQAAARLASLGYDSVRVKSGDGWYGWPEAAPFDAVIVTAVGEELPPRLFEQLAVGGRMVLPLGPEHGGQMLVVISKSSAGEPIRDDVLPVQFVPLTGDH